MGEAPVRTGAEPAAVPVTTGAEPAAVPVTMGAEPVGTVMYVAEGAAVAVAEPPVTGQTVVVSEMMTVGAGVAKPEGAV
jgi:hypothetical protein